MQVSPLPHFFFGRHPVSEILKSWFASALLISGKCLQDEDFVVDKDDGGSPTDESGGEDSDASDSGDEKEVYFVFIFLHYLVIQPLYSLNHWCASLTP